MKIRHKLNLNIAFIAFSILLIAGFSLSGMKYVQSRLHILTERSTPYQLKTVSLQRALQEHTANLLKVSAVRTSAELASLSDASARSLAEVKQLSGEVAAFKGEFDRDTHLGELEKITREIPTTIAERIKAEEGGRAADRLINNKLQLITASLQRIDGGMKRTQKTCVGEISSANDSVKRNSIKINLTQGVSSSLNDIKTGCLEIVAADQKSSLEAAKAKVAAAGKSVTKSLFMRSERHSAIGKELSDGVAEILKQVAAPGGLAETRLALLSKDDEAARRKLSQAMNGAVERVMRLSALVSEYGGKVTEVSREDGKRFDRALENSVILSETLASNADLVQTGAEIKAVVKELFSARSNEELERIKHQGDLLFAKANALLAGKMKRVEGTAGVVGALAEVKRTLVMPGGVVETLRHVLVVNQKVAALNEKLKGIVNEQRKEGESGILSARTDQENAIKSVNSVFRYSIMGVVAIGCAILITTVFFSFMMGRSITRPIGVLTNLAEHFGRGDFNVKMDGSAKDEFGALAIHFNTASLCLTEIVTDLKRAVALLGENSIQLTETSCRLINGSNEQASQAVQSATALEQLVSTISEVAQNANMAADATRDASSVALHGKETVAKAVQGMREIARSVGEAQETVQKLRESSEKIGSIVQVINEIADQTNLLSLNAAIEAARAGEQGLGFAIVADEVRKLAVRTTEATKEIAAMVQEIQGDTGASVRTMHKGSELVDQGVELAHEASRALELIVTASDKGASMVELIATASTEQANVAQQVAAGVERMAQLSKAADIDSGGISDKATELAGIADDLSRKASWFNMPG